VLSTLIPGLLVLGALACWHHGRNGHTKGLSMSTSKFIVLAALVVFIVTAVVCFLSDATSIPHLIGGVAIGLAVWAASGLVA